MLSIITTPELVPVCPELPKLKFAAMFCLTRDVIQPLSKQRTPDVEDLYTTVNPLAVFTHEF